MRREISLPEKLFQRLGHNYILVMMIITRLCGTFGGLLVIYYVELTLKIPPVIRLHFRISSIIVVVLGCTLTVLLALWETRTVRRVLKKFRAGEEVDSETASRAAHESMIFLARHHWHEAWLVPCSTLVPVLVVLYVLDNASTTILGNIVAAVFMGIAMALMSTFFVVEHCMQPVIRFLLNHGVQIDYDQLPVGRLRFRFRLCFALILMTTALMIGTLARQRASDILEERDPQTAAQAVSDLRQQSIYISIAAVVVGVVFSTLLANSVAHRAAHLVRAMERVGAGSLSERVQPTGNDEIDRLARQFNSMVQTLEQHDHTIRDLNTNLERKVRERTQQLELTLQDLRAAQTQLTDVAHRAGMAEIATGVLHNVGNVLNSVNISATLLHDRIQKSKLEDINRLVGRLGDRGSDLQEFFEGDRGPKFIEYLSKLTAALNSEREDLRQEVDSLTEKVGHIRGIISAQQSYARRVCFREQVDARKLVQEILEMHRSSLARHQVRVATDYGDVPPAHLEKAKLIQVLDNIVKNAIESMSDTEGVPRSLTIRTELRDGKRARIVISDTGRGISPDCMSALFTYGFTTKRKGNGFGLHSSALAMSALGGSIRVRSEGIGKGATFEVEFPLQSAEETDRRAPQRDDELSGDAVIAAAR